MEQRVNIKFCFKLGRMATETHEMLVKVDAVSQKCVFEWFKRFRDGKEDVEDEPRSGRPPTSTTPDNIDRVRRMIADDRRLSLRMIAEELKINLDSVSNISDKHLQKLKCVFIHLIERDSFFCQWCHLLVDVDAAVSLAWKKERLKSIDSIDVGGAFSVRRIFAVSKDIIHNSEGIWMVNYDELPKQMSISRAIPQTYISITCSDEAPAGTKEDGCRRTDSDRTAPSSSWLHFDRNRLAEDGAVKPSAKLKPPKSMKSRPSSGNELVREDAECDGLCFAAGLLPDRDSDSELSIDFGRLRLSRQDSVLFGQEIPVDRTLDWTGAEMAFTH
ncbi:hypothetical protein AVEN_120493-2 [Araneus ventricosus]|uniref:Uncharacterized protein n=1 Tax=Araneus ventricosus TaxID=182803 RepID=A0A4Y2MM62_ARAVE|nr:hypothetical protein AVEN_120493-2 [Araneus ventricosus]